MKNSKFVFSLVIAIFKAYGQCFFVILGYQFRCFLTVDLQNMVKNRTEAQVFPFWYGCHCHSYLGVGGNRINEINGST